MTITDPLVLPADVALIPAQQLPEELREQTGCDEGDVVMTRRHARAGSVAVDRDTAALLESFRQPRTIVDAVISFSRTHSAEPEAILESAYPALRRLVETRMLVPADADDNTGVHPTVRVGEHVLGSRVLRHVQVLDDVEVHLARSPEAGHVAVKLARDPSGSAARRLDAEAEVLRGLGGAPAPRLVTAGEHAGHPVLVTQWCPGTPADQYAAELRRLPAAERRPALLRLCVAVTEAVAALHERGVVHGDLHPRNILVDADGSAHLVDFGLAQPVAAAAETSAGQRGGMAFLLEPELAAARLGRRAPGPATPAGEQYTLGAVLYLLVTGAHYTDFALDEEKVMRQILADTPVSFAAREHPAWPELESVLATALAKDPGGRHPDVRHLAGRLSAVVPPVAADHAAPSTPAGPTGPADGALSATVLRQVWLPDAPVTAAALPPPRSSVTYGAAGVAYGLYRIALRRGDPELLASADLWVDAARQPHAADEHWLNEQVGVTLDRVGEVSPYHRLAGVQLVRALVAHAMGNLPEQRSAVAAFAAESTRPGTNPDLTLGRSGTLLASALLYDCVAGDPDSRDAVAALGTETFTRQLTYVTRAGPVDGCRELDYLGVAHGWAGVLYSLLLWCRATGSAVPDAVPGRLDELAALAQPAGRGVVWPVRTTGEAATMPGVAGWCNGSAGQVKLWCLAHELLGDQRFLTLAERAAWHAWEAPPGVASVCCGLAGRAYGLLSLARRSGDESWRRRAAALAALAAHRATGDEGYPYSLYKGQLGVVLLTEELADPHWAAFPLFELEGYRTGAEQRPLSTGGPRPEGA